MQTRAPASATPSHIFPLIAGGPLGVTGYLAFACSIRSGREETKFHQIWRGPSIVSPPTITSRAGSSSALRITIASGRSTKTGQTGNDHSQCSPHPRPHRLRAPRGLCAMATQRRAQVLHRRRSCRRTSQRANGGPRLGRHYTDAFAFRVEHREVCFLVMDEGGIGLFIGGRQRHPGLQSKQS